MADHADYWKNAAVRTDKLETLFEVSSEAVGNNSFDALSYIYSQRGNYGDLIITSALYSLFEPSDVRLALYPTNPMTQPTPALPGSFRPGITWVNKFPSFTGDYSDTKVIRLSEIYLIAAEASLPTNEGDARVYLNFITSRRGATSINSTGSQLLEDIIRERRKELAFEGDRYMDYMRLKRDVSRGSEYPAAVQTIQYSNFRRILPIPQAETDANPDIRGQQNPEY